uniref:Uncharacterized protein n=1 Tax=Romanomermis culicivorax TaxID=13658 RepID=A0A915I6B6_ROMCU
MYKLAIRDCLQYETDTALPPIQHKVDDVWIQRVAANQPLGEQTYQGTHYRYHPSTILSFLQVNGDWFGWRTSFMPLAALLASPCSAAEYTYMNNLLLCDAQNKDSATCTTFYN